MAKIPWPWPPVPGRKYPSRELERSGLDLGDVITYDDGTKAIVEKSPFSDKWHIRRLTEPRKKDTDLEQIVESILNSMGYRENIDYEKQYKTERGGFFLDFAFPERRLAIEPHATYWNGESTASKRKKLKEMGWTVLWYDEDDLHHKRNKVEKEIHDYLNR